MIGLGMPTVPVSLAGDTWEIHASGDSAVTTYPSDIADGDLALFCSGSDVAAYRDPTGATRIKGAYTTWSTGSGKSVVNHSSYATASWRECSTADADVAFGNTSGLIDREFVILRRSTQPTSSSVSTVGPQLSTNGVSTTVDFTAETTPMCVGLVHALARTGGSITAPAVTWDGISPTYSFSAHGDSDRSMVEIDLNLELVDAVTRNLSVATTTATTRKWQPFTPASTL